MYKYLLGTVLVFVIAFYLVNYGLKQGAITKKIDYAMDVPHGEYDTMGIKKAENSADGWEMYLDGMRLYSTRKGTGTMCNTNVRIYFPEQDNAKLVMKFRYNIGPFLAKPLRQMSPQEALKPDSQYKLMQSLKEGYARQYGIRSMSKIVFDGFKCQAINN